MNDNNKSKNITCLKSYFKTLKIIMMIIVTKISKIIVILVVVVRVKNNPKNFLKR